MSDVILSARGIKKSYEKDGTSVEVLKGIDLDIYPNDFITIMGPSGAGKSTFLHILGSLDRRPQERFDTRRQQSMPLMSRNRAGSGTKR